MRYELNKYHRDIPDFNLIEDLKSVANTLDKKTVTIEEYENHGKFHPSTLTRRFGSWFDVLAKAGLEDSRSRLNIADEMLFDNLRNMWETLGRQPKYAEVKTPFSKYSAGTYDHRFGNLTKALEAFISFMNSDSEDFLVSEETKVNSNNADESKIKHRTSQNISLRLRFKILERDGFKCKKCGRSPSTTQGLKLEVDHIIPYSKGGETVEDNLETKCFDCNRGKSNAFEI